MPEPAMRPERDSLGEVLVPADRYWGAQTQRAIPLFNIGADLMPPEVVKELDKMQASWSKT